MKRIYNIETKEDLEYAKKYLDALWSTQGLEGDSYIYWLYEVVRIESASDRI